MALKIVRFCSSCCRYCRKCALGCGVVAFRVLTPKLTTYFGWLALFYFALALVVDTYRGWIQTALCKVPSSMLVPETSPYWRPTLGCVECSDKLLMCGKDQCFQSVMNLTYQANASDSFKSAYAWFELASQSDRCNTLLENTVSIVEVARNVPNYLDQTDPAQSACTFYVCGVLKNMFIASTDLYRHWNTNCTNTYGTKPFHQANECVCSHVPLSLADATTFTGFCSDIVAGIYAAVLYKDLSGKSSRYQQVMKAAAAQIPAEMGVMEADLDCIYTSLNADNILSLFTAITTKANLATAAPYTTLNSACLRVWCSAFNQSMYTLDWTEAPFNTRKIADLTPMVQVCSGMSLSEVQADGSVAYSSFTALQTEYLAATAICRNSVPNTASVAACIDLNVYLAVSGPDECRGEKPSDADCYCCFLKIPCCPSLAASVERAGSSSASRRLGCSESNGSLAARRDAQPAGSASGQWQAIAAADDGELLRVQDSADLWISTPQDDKAWPLQSSENAVATGASDVAAPGAVAEASRSLQDSTGSAAAALNDDLMEYTTGEWSRCTCHFQCIRGTKTRNVGCESNKCKDPMPSSRAECVCDHCASCDVDLTLMILSIAFYTGGGIAFIVCLAWLKVDALTDDDMSDFGCLLAIHGFICKSLPFLLRFLMFVNGSLLIVLILKSIIPISGFEYDCNDVGNLQFVVILACGVWILFLIGGRTMKKMRPVPPWLFQSPFKTTALYLLCKPFRSIGP